MSFSVPGYHDPAADDAVGRDEREISVYLTRSVASKLVHLAGLDPDARGRYGGEYWEFDEATMVAINRLTERLAALAPAGQEDYYRGGQLRRDPDSEIQVKAGDAVRMGENTFGTVVNRVEGSNPTTWAISDDETGLIRLYEDSELILVDPDFGEGGQAAWQVG